MRLASLALVLAAASSFAHADTDDSAGSPPSKTLERAIKLYDRKDFFSTTIELEKVLEKETGDDAGNTQRAQFFMGKALYQMGFYVASDAQFDQIANDPTQRYVDASMKWLVALARVLPLEDVPGFRAYKLAIADDPSMASVRDEIEVRLGEVALKQNDLATADKAFRAVGASSDFYPHARFGLGLTLARKGDDKAALAAFGDVPATGDAHDLALLGIAAVHARAGKWDDASATAGKVHGLTPVATWEGVVARAAKRGSLGGLASYAHAELTIDGAEPSLLRAVATCGDRSDALAAFRADAPKVAKQLDALVAAVSDGADMYEQHGAALRAGSERALDSRASAIVAAMLAGPSLDRAFAYVTELDHELAQLQQSDKAWQTTQVAANILQELTVARAVAATDAGKHLRDRLTHIAAGVRAIAGDHTKLTCE